ncbi:Ig-like domain repeat protein, partial [Bacillus subtilis]|nr:Ig-like domain repeat protein [Bacillus subtilis]
DDTKPTISGSGAEGGSIVKIYDGTTLLGQTIANANGTWSFTPTTDLAEGVHTFTATSTDAAGNEGTASMPWSIEVDLTGPDAKFKPEIVSASDDVLPNTGLLTNGEFTNDTTPRLNGKGAEANGLIRIYSEGKLLGTVQADKDGNWTFDVPTLSEGKHDFIATTVDAAGNEGTSSDVFSLSVDTTAPVASDAAITAVTDAVEPHVGNIVSGGLTNDARPVVSGTAKDGVTLVRIYDGTTLLGEVAVTDGAWTFQSESDLSNGVHNFRIKAVDAAGNEGPYSPTWSVTVDTAAPNAPSITTVYDDVNAVQGNVADGKSTDDLRPTLSGGSAEAGSTVKIYDKGVLLGETIANSNGTWTFTPDADLATGSHVFTVTSTDKAGNESVPSASWTITIDLSIPKTPTIDQIWDDTNPGIGPVGKGETTNDTTPTLSGTAAAGTVVKIFVNGTLLGETVATAAGTWTYTGFVADGTHTFTVQSVNAVGTESALSDPFTIVVSTAVPGTPSITEVSDDVGTVTGKVDNGKTTDDTKPTISGKADANATVNIYDNGALLGQAKADGDGKWTFTPATDLSEGAHAFTAKVVDGAGTEGQPSFPYTITVDTTAPEAPRFTVGYDGVGPVIGEFGDGAIINDNRPKLSGAGAEPNAVVSIYQGATLVATVRADAGGQWSWKATDALADGTYTFTAKTTDAAGNVSAASDAFKVTVDTVAPNKPVIAQITDAQEPIVGDIAKDGFTNDTTPTLKGTGAEANGLVRIYDGTTLIGEVTADASGNWSYTPVNPLSNGPHTFTVVSVDAAGNVSVKSDEYKITVDTLAPASPSITNVQDDVGAVLGTVANGKTTDDTKPRLSGSGAESGSIVKIYDNGVLLGQTIANANGTWAFTPTTDLKEGAHSFTVTATDKAGNESGESIAWVVTVDLTPPAKPEITAVFDDVAPGIGNVPNGTPTNDPTPTLAGKGDAGTTIRVYDGTVLLGETTVRADGTWAYTAPLLADGSHTFTVKSVDDAGNVSATSNSWSVVISTIPPEVPKIENLANNNGSELIQVANNGVTNDQDPLLTGTAQPNLVIRIYDNGALLGSTTADADGKWSFNFKTANVKLSEGYHSLTAAAVNELGFEGSQSFPRIVTIDITPPASPVIVSAADDVGSIINPAMPNGSLTDDTLPSFRGTTDAYHVIKLYRDGGILVGQATADGSGNWQIQLTEPLDSKTHNFYATATDPAGNTSINSSGIFKLTVDAIAPDAPKITRIVDNVPDHTGTIAEGGLTNDPAPRVEGTSEANATINIYAGSLLVGTVKANSSGAWSMKLPEGLPDGSYVITATATDAAGNTGPASAGYTIVVDTRAPDVPQITHVVDDVPGHTGEIGNRQTTNDNLPLIVGKGEKGTTIAVYDNGTYLGTTTVGADGSWSYQVTRVLGDGTHKFTATATDPAGNTTGSSNTLEIIIDTVAPGTPRIDDAYDSELGRTMSSGTYTKDKTPTLRGTAEAYSIVEIFDDVYGVIGTTTANGSGGWSFTLPDAKGLPDGIYNFKARATDLAGNTGSAMGTGFRLIIDTVPPVAPVIEQVIDAVAGGIVGNIPSNGLTNDTYPTLSGKAEAGTTLTFYGGPNGTSTLGTLVVPASGVWTYKTSYLSNGEHKFVVKSVDAAGNETYSKAPYVITVDSSAPSTPVVTSVYDSTQPVVGNISSNGWTNETKPTFQGTAEAGSTLTIIHNNVEVGTVLVGPDGKWTWKPTTDLKDGSNSFNFKATDAAGNTSGSTSTFTMNVDTVPPVAATIDRIYDNVAPITGDVPKDGYTNDATPTIYVTAEAYSTVIIYDNGVEVARYTLGNTTSWSWTPSQNISEGDHVYTVKQIDRAGQESPLSEPWKITVDLLAPPAPVILQVWDDVDLYVGPVEQGKLTNDNTPTVSGTGIAGTKVTVYANGNAVGTVIVGADNKWSLTTSRLGEGTVLLTAKAEDQAGNPSATSNSWSISVDTVAPSFGRSTSDQIANLDSYHDTSKSYFEFSRTVALGQFGVKAVAILDGKVVATADVDTGTGKFNLKVPFSENKGWNTYQFAIMDEAGNIAYYQNSLFDYQYNSVLGNIYHDDAKKPYFFINNSDEVAPPPVITFYGDVIGTVKSFIYDDSPTDATSITVYGYAKSGTGATSGRITLYKDGVEVGSAIASSGNGKWVVTVNNLSEGAHKFTATYTIAGTTSVLSEAFEVVVDLTPPDIPVIVEIIADEGLYAGKVDSGGVTNDKTVIIKGTTEPLATVRIYDGSSQIGEVKADANGNWVYTTNALSDGTHTFRTLGIDRAGNIGQLDLSKPGYVVTVDTQPPAAPAINDALDDVGSVTGSVKSDGVTDDTKPLLQGTAEYGSTVRIYGTDGKTIIGTAVTDAITGKWTFQIPTDLAEGKHTFTAEAVDKAGNVGPKSAAFNITVDTTAPDAPKITRVVDDVAPKLDDLVDGSSTNDTRPTFYGTAEANSTVRVYVGGVEIGTAKADASGNWNFTPAADKALTEGTHVITFKAMDAAGNLSTAAASFTVKVDLTAPAKPQIDQIIDAVGLETGPVSNNGTTDDSRPTFKGKGEAGGTVSIMANGKLLGTTIVEADGTWSFKPTAAMTVEAHTITVTVADAAGNVSVASDAWKITIIRPAGGEPQGFSADMPDSGDMHSFSARSAHTDQQDDLLPEPQAHAAPMSLDTSALLAELDVQDGQNYGEGGYDAEAYDDQSVLAGLIDLAQASSDISGQAEQPAEEADVTQIIQDALTEPAPQESIDLSALPEEQAPAAGTTAPVTETQPEPVAAPVQVPAPMNTGDLDLERLLQQTSTHI